jgi:hypothetical protein
VHLEPHLHQVLDHLLNLRLVGAFLHGNNHKKQPSAFSPQRSAIPLKTES